MKYIVEYRPRVPGAMRNYDADLWRRVQEFSDPAEAKAARDDAVKYEMKGTKDWRVRTVV